MELKHVKIFVLAAELLNFSKVADLSFISQSSVTKYIQSLEEELDGTLFLRDGRKMILSEFGKEFLPYAVALLDKEQESLEVLRSFKAGRRYNTLRIGVEESLFVAPPDVFFIKVAASINQLHRADPSLHLNLQYYNSDDLNTLLDSGEIDLSLRLLTNYQTQNQADSAIEFVCLDLCRNYLAVSGDTDTDKGYLDVLKQIDTYIYDKQPMPQNITFSVTNQYGLSAGLKTYRHWTELYTEVILSNGRFATILPENMKAPAEACGLKLLRIDDFPIYTGLYGFWKRENENPYIHSFVQELGSRYQPLKE